MSGQKINRICGRLVLGLSLFAMILVVGAAVMASLGGFDPAPGGDEGTAAHLFQIAIGLLVVVGPIYLATADWRQPWKVVRRLVIPALALVVAFATLYYLEHVRHGRAAGPAQALVLEVQAEEPPGLPT